MSAANLPAEEKHLREITDDIAELQTIVDNHVKRDSNRLVVETWIQKLDYEKNCIQKRIESQKPKKLEDVKEEEEEKLVDPMAAVLSHIDKTTYEPINKWAYENSDGQKIKIYITSNMDGVGKIPKDNISCEFQTTYFDLKVQGLNGKNYRLRIPQLQNDVELAECKHNVKSNSISITLKKSKDEFWTDLKPKATLMSKKTDKEAQKEEEDGGMINMMKEMYQNGDLNTQRMIQESWEKAHEEKTGRRPKSTATVVQEKLAEMRKKNEGGM